MAATQRVRVELGSRSYDIIIGDGLIARAGEFWEPLRLGRRGVLIADENTHHRWAAPLRDALARAGYETTVLEIPAGEPSKTLARVQSLVERMTGLGLDRRSFVVAVGG
ncbi:MAG: 3-dehydroquinate synthase, partial [Verrucomicrobiae bacterium]|nr:3-dehydroquinate synthase [Verrucomicrobiae bacterium]